MNIIWKTKFTTYPFEFSNGVNGNIIVKDKGGVTVEIFSENEKTLFQYKNFEKAMIAINGDLAKKFSK